ncbi:hypothetical protein RO3G_15442 [Rhizopus delemar RA 99-880]|uniref:Uncharacterized protein n=1 Tax=Rhizopus delemar (strain RA 99-880 / ATCC MYA-4621 / FGSC 9543 / NRRL 43880) TaxID=246409 RepID=I1CQK1_RHIO9|nr:hypothetical protein RO3G_15442 [Rhizopus delemar RA 99-880]|eukprot:EIE90731.1 hypothetical protein RO3G_15442 [Rhizopus delemar RA 99-880]
MSSNPEMQEENNSFVQYTPENIIEKLEQPAVTTPKPFRSTCLPWSFPTK